MDTKDVEMLSLSITQDCASVLDVCEGFVLWIDLQGRKCDSVWSVAVRRVTEQSMT